MRWRTDAYQGFRNISFSENFVHVLNGYFLSVSRSSFHAFYLTVLQKKYFFFQFCQFEIGLQISEVN